MLKLTAVEARPSYQLWLRYNDGVQGVVDLAPLVGRGVFAAWEDAELFAQGHIGVFGEVSWGEGLELCPDALYLRITGKTSDEVFETPAFAHA
jgi:hypothetical protein